MLTNYENTWLKRLVVLSDRALWCCLLRHSYVVNGTKADLYPGDRNFRRS
nr:hypothetical protein [Dendronalium sp. ChiSLP03b]